MTQLARGSASRTIDQEAMMDAHREGRRRRTITVLRGVAGVVIALALWELISRAYDLEVILPTPITVLTNTINTLTLHGIWTYGANVYSQVGTSLLQGAIGFGFGVLAGIPLGLLLGRVRFAYELISPIVRALYPIPSIAWIPLTILWFGLGTTAIIVTVALGVFFPVLFNVEEGARSVPAIHIEAGRCFGARGFRLFARVILPSSIPFLISGLRIAVGTGWRVVIASEILISQSGIGFIMNQSRFYFRTADLMTAMIVVAIIGYVSERFIVGTLERRTTKIWREAAS